MILTLSAPAKTFLVGEYAVLAGGPALMLSTAPRFQLRVTRGETAVIGIPTGSPAARWLDARRPLLEDFALEFIDPYEGAGGLGASGAQFLMVHVLTTFLQSAFARTIDGPDLSALWSDYRALAAGGGSGADVLAQATGGVAEVDLTLTTARARPWPYPELGWTLVRTHRRVATHEHVATLAADTPSLFVRPAQECVEAFGAAPAEVFVSKLKVFTETIAEYGLRAETTANLIERLASEPWCLLAKGCGALGAEVILILHPSTERERERVREHLRRQSLHTIATDRDMTHGLEIQWT